jgi:hypothetical protein
MMIISDLTKEERRLASYSLRHNRDVFIRGRRVLTVFRGLVRGIKAVLVG